MKRKLFSLLVLLLTAVSGAWADATIAKLWVGNSEEVTSEGTITGTGATEGTASVAIENGSMVLTLNNFKFNGCGYNDSGIYYQSNANGNTPLIIKIEGDNEITLPGGTDKSLYGFFLYGGNGDHVFTITGSGSLTVTVGDGNLSNGIFVQQADLVLAGGTVTANAGSAGAEFKSLGVSVPQGTLTIDGGTLKASGSTTSASRGINVNNNVTIKSGELEAYGYSKGIKNSGGDALVFAEGVTPTLFKAGDNEASATDVSKYEGQKYLHVVCTGGDEPAAPTGDGVNYALSVGTNDHSTMKFYVGQDEVTKAKEGETVTIVVTPDDGWSIGNVTGQWIAAMAKAPRRTAGIGLLQDVDVTFVSEDAQTGAHTYTFVMQRAKAEFSVVYKKHLDHPDITISNILPVTYNAQAHTPSFTVKDGSKVLVLGTDYTVTYSDNVMACDKDAAENAPTVTIKAVEGHNFYVGENSKTFTIRKKTLEDGFMSKVADLTYNGKAQEPAPTLTYDGITLVEGKDYVFSYINNKDVASTTDAKAPVVTASAVKNSNFTGAATQKFNIKKAPLTVKAADVNIIHGSEVPEYEVSYEGFVAEETKDVLEGTLTITCDYTKESPAGSTYDITPSGLTAKNYDITFVPGKLTVLVDQAAPYKETLQTAIAIASNINPEALADAIAAAQAAMTAEDATAESLTQANKTLETAIKAYLGEILPGLGAIVEGLNDETLNAAYADAEAALAKEDVTLQELVAAMQQIIAAAQAVAPEHLQNLKGYAVKYGATDAATLIDNALAAIEAGNVAQIIATMTAVKEAATPLAQQVLSTMIGYVQAFGLKEQAAQAQAALESGNYITMITTAKALFTHLIAAAKEYLPKLGDIATGLNDETLNTAYAAAQELLAKESITPEELGAAMQNIIAAAKAVAPEHLQNLKEYAEKYGAEDAATLIDAALEAIESGNVSQIIATMTAVKEAATPLAEQVLGTMINYVQAFGLTEQAAQAQAALESGNYITMITTAKALFSHLIAAAKEYLPKLGAIAEGLNDETLNSAYAAAQALLAKESITPEELGAAMQNIIAAAKAVAPEHLQNLKGYAEKYGATDAATLIDAALEAIESGNVSQIIATMTAVKEAATPLAQQVLGTMIGYVQAFGLTEQAAQAQAALESGNYITMITTAKELFSHLIAAAKEYLPKLGAIAEGLNDETLNSAYAAAQALLAKESITPEELGTAMQNIIAAAKAVAPEHLQNLKGYAEKYGAEDAATLIDAALEAIESGNVSQIIATMTAVKEAATPLATAILTQMIEKAQSYTGFEEDITEAQAALESGNYITMITAAKALYAKLQAVVTGVGSMKAAFEKDVWYDLNGHKLNGKPTKKGVYFINGKKVVIK